MKLAEYLRVPVKRGDLGIEIEVEAERALPMNNLGCWTAKGDGSLRVGGVEYLTRQPISADKDKINKIQMLTSVLQKPEYKVLLNSPRTSVHVHVNVLGLSLKQIWTALTTGFLIENLLIKYCDENLRQGNQYCLRIKDAERVLEFYIKNISSERPFWNLDEGRFKYSNINLTNVKKLGTIEFRGLRGTIDPVYIDRWSTICHQLIHNSSKNFSSPAEVLDTWFGLDKKEAFLAKVFSPDILELVLNIHKDWAELIEENVGMLLPLAYCQQWNEWEKAFQLHAEKLPPPNAPIEWDMPVPQRRRGMRIDDILNVPGVHNLGGLNPDGEDRGND